MFRRTPAYACMARLCKIIACLLPGLSAARFAAAAPQTSPGSGNPTATEPSQRIEQRLNHLRDLTDVARAGETKQLALDIRALPSSDTKVMLAMGLAMVSTEGDFGRDALQNVATTLATTIRERPATKQPISPYTMLARLVHYEGVTASLDLPAYAAAMAELKANDRMLANADFTLSDLSGRAWTRKALRGKVVLVNFWATWCPPCRKELPDLVALQQRFKAQGLVVLGITDEKPDVVRPFAARNRIPYPLLIDAGHKVSNRFKVFGIPCSLLYDRSGKLVAQAIDMRTKQQLLGMLARAGLR